MPVRSAAVQRSVRHTCDVTLGWKPPRVCQLMRDNSSVEMEEDSAVIASLASINGQCHPHTSIELKRPCVSIGVAASERNRLS